MQIDKIKSYISSAGYDFQDYSGRGMNGKRCLGIVVENDSAANVVLAIISAATENNPHDLSNEDLLDDIFELCSVLSDSKSDSLGHDTIIYWPRIEWVP